VGSRAGLDGRGKYLPPPPPGFDPRTAQSVPTELSRLELHLRDLKIFTVPLKDGSVFIFEVTQTF
jgi:hypothetical protein